MINKEKIFKQITAFFEEGKRVFCTSSFQTQSVPLLHILSQSKYSIPILFIDTRFHFLETLQFKEKLKKLMSLNIIDVIPSIKLSDQKDINGNYHYISNPDYCCNINKVIPLLEYMRREKYDVWISGIRRNQTENRKILNEIEETPEGIIRYHPILLWTDQDIENYRTDNHLPSHPLHNLGFKSIGCEPCTKKLFNNDARDNRWIGKNKTECGLHTTLIKKTLN
jgi:phosphoadenosine phosphosulfate reductase